MATIKSFRIKRGEFVFLSRFSFLRSALAIPVSTGGRYLEAVQSRLRREKSPNVHCTLRKQRPQARKG